MDSRPRYCALCQVLLRTAVELEPDARPFAALYGPTGRDGVREVQAPPALVAGIGAARGPLKTRASIQHLHPEALRSKVHAHLHLAVVAPVFHGVGDQLRRQQPGVIELPRGQLGTEPRDQFPSMRCG